MQLHKCILLLFLPYLADSSCPPGSSPCTSGTSTVKPSTAKVNRLPTTEPFQRSKLTKTIHANNRTTKRPGRTELNRTHSVDPLLEKLTHSRNDPTVIPHKEPAQAQPKKGRGVPSIETRPWQDFTIKPMGYKEHHRVPDYSVENSVAHPFAAMWAHFSWTRTSSKPRSRGRNIFEGLGHNHFHHDHDLFGESRANRKYQ